MKFPNKIGLVFLASIIVLFFVNPALSNLNFEFKDNDRNNTYRDTENVIIGLELTFSDPVESYQVSAYDKDDRRQIWSSEVVSSPTTPIRRSFNLGELPARDYYIQLEAVLMGMPPISYAEPFSVTRLPGRIRIIRFEDSDDSNSYNGERERLLPGGDFEISGSGGSATITGGSGVTVVERSPGEYTITELVESCWVSTTGNSQLVTVEAGQDSVVYFGSRPDTEITIIGYNDSNRNGFKDGGESGIPDFSFEITGPQSGRYDSDADGTVRFRGVPGTYTITCTPPQGMELIGPSSLMIDPCQDKEVRFGAWRPPVLMITDVIPRDNSRLGSHNVIFAWKTNIDASGDLLLRPSGVAGYTRYSSREPESQDHSIIVPNLTRNTCYEFKATSRAGSQSVTTSVTRFCLDNGVAFTRRTYLCDVEDQYNQSCTIGVMNTDSEPHRLLVNLTNPYSDLYLGFIGDGSLDRIVTLNPGETLDLRLMIHAQDTRQENYTVMAHLSDMGEEEITDHAYVMIKVHSTPTDFIFEEVDSDPFTHTKTFRIENQGGPIRNLTIVPEDQLENMTVLSPHLFHYQLEEGESVEFRLSPIWSAQMESIEGELTAATPKKNVTLPVSFACAEGQVLQRITLKRPVIYYDFDVSQCINAFDPIRRNFPLPPGLNDSQVLYAQVGLELVPHTSQTRPYELWVELNGNEVDRMKGPLVDRLYKIDISPTDFSYSQSDVAVNRLTIHDNMDSAYSVILKRVRVELCLEELELYVCARTPEEATTLAWNASWIYRPGKISSVVIDSPKPGQEVMVGRPVLIRATVKSASGPQLHSQVHATINNSDQGIFLADDGDHGDGLADDGVYAGTWVLPRHGPFRITIQANNCASEGSANTTVNVLPNLNVNVNDEINVSKSLDPEVLEATEVNTTKGSLINYSITLVPTRGRLENVVVVDNLPSYLDLVLDSLDPEANVTPNSDGEIWRSTRIEWRLRELTAPTTLRFQARFRWQLPADISADAEATMPSSRVSYINNTGNMSELKIPEAKIRLVALSSPEQSGMPGFGALVAVVALIFAGFWQRKK